MEIHRYEKLWLGASMVLIVAFIATVTYGAVGAGISMIDDEGGTIDPDDIGSHEKFETVGELHEVEDSDAEYEVGIVARQFIFEGATLRSPLEIPANTPVTFYITSPDVIHGFQIIGTNANTMVIPGQVAEMTVEFDEPGTYGIVCNEFCGAGHENMEGLIEVVPEDEWDDPENGGDA